MPGKPNIILIMTEQHRGDCLSIAGHPALLTPNMDSIAGRGVFFRNCYTPCPTCIAARRSLLSGQFPSEHGMVGFKEGVEWAEPPTLPQVLKDNGYHTYLVGRSMHQHPARKRFGFDHMVTDEYHDWAASQVPNIYCTKKGRSTITHTSGVMHNDYTARPWHLPEELHHTNWAVNQALKFMDQRDPDCPFFLTLSFQAAHPPLVPPQFYLDRYLRMDLPEPCIGNWEQAPVNQGLGLGVSNRQVNLTGELMQSARAGYYGLINHVDDQIRRILNPIDRLFDPENTIILFTSDHGEMLGDHYMWHKTVPYEGAARIPLMMSIPGRFNIQKGTRVEDAVALPDIMPTLLDLAGIAIPETVTGRSLVPAMRKHRRIERDFLHIEHAPVHHTLTDAKEKFIWFVKDGREQFFDLTDDPHECHDLAGEKKSNAKIKLWRERLATELAGRPEGFSDGKKLIPGCNYSAVLPK